MSYLESERKKAQQLVKDCFYGFNAGGKYRKKPRNFVLNDANRTKNLYPSIANPKGNNLQSALTYFNENNIVWWNGRNGMPTGHLLSSQIACLNHLFPFRNDKRNALNILKNINSDFKEALPVVEKGKGYVEFEVVSKMPYLNEGTQIRGAICTSVDAMMLGIRNNKRIMVLIEWKYTESYRKSYKQKGKAGKTRASRYNHLIGNDNSPFKKEIDIKNYYYEPFYQLMRQTLLAWLMTNHKNVESIKADDWLHIDVIPENNNKLRENYHSHNLPEGDIEKAWRSVLKESSKYKVISPKNLLLNVLTNQNELYKYLNKRYWEQFNKET